MKNNKKLLSQHFDFFFIIYVAYLVEAITFIIMIRIENTPFYHHLFNISETLFYYFEIIFFYSIVLSFVCMYI